MPDTPITSIAVVKWAPHDETAETISHEFQQLGIQTTLFRFNTAIPSNVDMVLTFGPNGAWLPIPRQLANLSTTTRPILVHWNTENPVDPRFPRPLAKTISAWRSRLENPDTPSALANQPPLRYLKQRMYRFRYTGDYLYAAAHGWLDALIDSSEIFTQQHRSYGLPAHFVPWGTPTRWYKDLSLPRDIDVLWMGKRRTKRRSQLIEQIRAALTAQGFNLYVADGEEHPFIFGPERIRILNRAKITLNLLAGASYDDIFTYRFHVAAGNRSLVISEPEFPHCRRYQPNHHYIAAPRAALLETILYYLHHEPERQRITENAYQLVTQEMTFRHSLQTLLQIATSARAAHPALNTLHSLASTSTESASLT